MNNRLRILLVAANPKDTLKVALEEELRRLRKLMSDNVQMGNAEVMVAWAARALDLRDAVRENQPHIVHFAGHGSYEGIWLEDDEGNSQLLSKDCLSLILSASDQLRLVVLNACATAPQTEALRRSVDYVVGTPAPIEESVALNFTSQFYRGLAVGDKIRDAFCHAQEGLGGSQHDRYQLFVRDEVDGSEPLLPGFVDEVVNFRAKKVEGTTEVANTFNIGEIGTLTHQPGNKRSQVNADMETSSGNVRVGNTVNYITSK
jgi:CHAT domain